MMMERFFVNYATRSKGIERKVENVLSRSFFVLRANTFV